MVSACLLKCSKIALILQVARSIQSAGFADDRSVSPGILMPERSKKHARYEEKGDWRMWHAICSTFGWSCFCLIIGGA